MGSGSGSELWLVSSGQRLPHEQQEGGPEISSSCGSILV